MSLAELVKRLYKPVQNVLRPVALGVLLAYCGSSESQSGSPDTDGSTDKVDPVPQDEGEAEGETLHDYWLTMSVPDRVGSRNDHQAFWTGSEMIIWGGYTGPGDTSGERYDPMSDQWGERFSIEEMMLSDVGGFYRSSALAESELFTFGHHRSPNECTIHGRRYNLSKKMWRTVTPPVERVWMSFPQTLWTGSEVVLFGGSRCEEREEIFNSGGRILRYNPSTDSWRVMTGEPADFLSEYDELDADAIWTGSEILVFQVNQGGRYNLKNDSYRSFSASELPGGNERGEAVVWTGSEIVVLYPENDGGARYNPETDTWTRINMKGAPEMRYNQKAVWTGSEIVVWGGLCFDCYKTGGQEGGIYNPITDSWRRTSRKGVPETRVEFSAIWSGSEMIVWGGHGLDDNYGDRGSTTINTGGRYRP